MKKFLVFLSSIIISATLLTACSSTPVSPVTRAGFLKKDTLKSVSPIEEHCVYTVNYQAATSPAVNAKYSIAADKSYLKTDLSVVQGDGTIGEAGKNYYLFETTTHIEGKYEIEGSETDCVNDVYSKVYFLGVEDDLKPVYSEKTVNADSLISLNGKLSVKKYVYTTSIRYEGGKAKVTVTPDLEKSTGTFSVTGEYETEKVFEGNYFDNEQLLFAPRAMDLNSSFSTTFKSIDAVSKSLNDMSLSYATGDNAITKVSFEKGDYVLTADSGADKNVTSCKVATINLTIASTYSGATQRLSFAASDEVDEYCRLIYMAVPATYGTGEFIFRIKSATVSFD